MGTGEADDRERKGGRVEGLSDAQLKLAAQVGKRIQSVIIENGHVSLAAFETAAVKQGQEHIYRGDLYKIVSGARSPTVKALIRIAGVLGEDLFQLLFVPKRSPRQRLVDRIRRAPKRTIERLNEVIEAEDLPLG